MIVYESTLHFIVLKVTIINNRHFIHSSEKMQTKKGDRKANCRFQIHPLSFYGNFILVDMRIKDLS